MKKRFRILSVIILAAALVFCAVFSGCAQYISISIIEGVPLWIGVKSVGGENGLFAEGQGFNFTLCFGYESSFNNECQIAVITDKNIFSDTADEETQTFVIDEFNDEKYYKKHTDSSTAALELSYPAPANQPCTGALEIFITCYKDEAAYEAGEYLWWNNCTVKYLAESGVGTIIGHSIDELWKRRCDILLAGGKFKQDEYQSEMHKLQETAGSDRPRHGVSSGWTETGLRDGGDASFLETVDGSGIMIGTFSATTDNKTVTVSYLAQLDSGYCNIWPGKLYGKHKQIFYLTAETENGVETWFVLYKDGKLTLSRPVSGWCGGHVNGYYIIVTDSRDGDAETYYQYTDDMTLPELENYNT
jgi:hypothetical protein